MSGKVPPKRKNKASNELHAVTTSELSEVFVEDCIKPIIEACVGNSNVGSSSRSKELWQFDPHGDDFDDDFEPISECISTMDYRSKASNKTNPNSLLNKKSSRSMKRQPFPFVNFNNNNAAVTTSEDNNNNQSSWAGLLTSTVLKTKDHPDETPNAQNWMDVTAKIDSDHQLNLRVRRDSPLR